MTHVFFDSEKIDWAPYMARQMRGQGYVMHGRGNDDQVQTQPRVFRGLRYVRGYGAIKNIMGSVGRFLLPLAQNLATTAQKEVIGQIGHVAGDVASGKALPEAIMERGKQTARRFGSRLQQCIENPNPPKGQVRGEGKRLGYRSKNIKIKNILRDLATMEIGHDQKPPSSTIQGKGKTLAGKGKTAAAEGKPGKVRKPRTPRLSYLDFN
jgi:hypothetical protein